MQKPQKIDLPQHAFLFHSTGHKVVLIVLLATLMQTKISCPESLPVIQKAIGISLKALSLLSTPACRG